MIKEKVTHILDKIKEYDRIIIFRHARPDGDAVGSTKGLQAILKLSFPEKEIFDYVKTRANREIDIKEAVYRNNLWLSLKITFPHRDFEFDYSMANRFNPELDHIFPRNLAGMDEAYKQYVDVIWNMQPIKGAVNLDKSNHHPKLFFTDGTDKGKQLSGKKYYNDYDCIPEMSSADWNDYSAFIKNRRTKMIEKIKELYDITLIPDTLPTSN